MEIATKNILLVEDDRFLRRACEASLRQRGFTVSTAADGEEALRAIRAEPPALVLLDLLMPELGGMEVLKALRASPKTAGLPVLVITAHADEGSVREGFDVGATDYLAKPFSIPQLSARVRACLSRAAKA